MRSPQEFVFAECSAEADRSVSNGDSLDIKGNIWLVIITFLGTQTAYFLSKELPHWAHASEILSAFLLIGAGILTLWELYPRTYLVFHPSEGAIESRKAELEELYRSYEDFNQVVSTLMLIDLTEWAKQRSKANHAVNALKTAILTWAFWLATSAGIINLIILMAALRHPSSGAH